MSDPTQEQQPIEDRVNHLESELTSWVRGETLSVSQRVSNFLNNHVYWIRELTYAAAGLALAYAAYKFGVSIH